MNVNSSVFRYPAGAGEVDPAPDREQRPVGAGHHVHDRTVHRGRLRHAHQRTTESPRQLLHRRSVTAHDALARHDWQAAYDALIKFAFSTGETVTSCFRPFSAFSIDTSRLSFANLHFTTTLRSNSGFDRS